MSPLSKVHYGKMYKIHPQPFESILVCRRTRCEASKELAVILDKKNYIIPVERIVRKHTPDVIVLLTDKVEFVIAHYHEFVNLCELERF